MSKRIPRERIAEPRLTEGWCDLLNIDPASVQVEGRDNVFDILHCEFVMACGIPGPHMKEMWDTFGYLCRDVKKHPLYAKLGPPRGWKAPLPNKARMHKGKV